MIGPNKVTEAIKAAGRKLDGLRAISFVALGIALLALLIVVVK